jgi:signal transduction histidine kinase
MKSEQATSSREEQLKTEIEAVRRESRQYLQNVAHQLTAPLGAIKWSIEAIKDEEVSMARKQKLLSSVYSQATILVHLIKNFTLMSNLEADHELGEFRERDKVDVLRLSINLANDFQPQAAETDKKIVVDEDSFIKVLGVNQLLIVKNLVAQALSNLLENAVKYADVSSTILIACSSQKDHVGISVQSTGIPLKPEEVQEVIKRGYRGSKAQQQVPAGTGIGLYLADTIMKLHKGKVEIAAKNRTSLFTLAFPWNLAVRT